MSPSSNSINGKMLNQLLAEAGIVLPAGQIQKLRQYADLLTKKNQVLNLTRFKDQEELFNKHIVNSLFISHLVDWSKAHRAADIGTGGGLPGIPLAIVHPEVQFVLIDSVQKKVAAVREFAQELGLLNITCVSDRLEVLGQDKSFREQFDLVTALAVAPLPVLVELALPLVRVGGAFVAPKGPGYDEELEAAQSAIRHLKSGSPKIIPYDLPRGVGKRFLLCFKKDQLSPSAYPRKTGLPSKSPL